MELSIPDASLKLKTLEVEKLILKSKDGLHEFEVFSTHNGVSLVVSNLETRDSAFITSDGDRLGIGLNSKNDLEKNNPLTFAMMLVDGMPVIQVTKDGIPNILPIG